MAEHSNQRAENRRPHTFVCSFPSCRMTFSRHDRLIIHMRTHTGEKPFECQEIGCGKSYARAAHLKRHQQIAHRKEEQPEKLRCTEAGCEKDFINKSNMNRHIEQVHKQKQYKCNFEGCCRRFRKHQQLKRHEIEHTNINPYQCLSEGCNKSFKTANHLHRHQKVHEGYLCEEEGCGKKFEKWTQLLKHRTLAHKQGYICETCGRRFFQKTNLTSHLRTHADTREVFECPREGCSRVYLEQRYLKAHILSYHDGRRFTCEIEGCRRTFVTKQKLIQHARLHDPNHIAPKKKSKKGQKKKSMALKLAMLGLWETGAEDLVVLDKQRIRRENLGHKAKLKKSSETYRDSSGSVTLVLDKEPSEQTVSILPPSQSTENEGNEFVQTTPLEIICQSSQEVVQVGTAKVSCIPPRECSHHQNIDASDPTQGNNVDRDNLLTSYESSVSTVKDSIERAHLLANHEFDRKLQNSLPTQAILASNCPSLEVTNKRTSQMCCKPCGQSLQPYTSGAGGDHLSDSSDNRQASCESTEVHIQDTSPEASLKCCDLSEQN